MQQHATPAHLAPAPAPRHDSAMIEPPFARPLPNSAFAWADSLDSMEGLPAIAPEARALGPMARARSALSRVSPGLSIAVLIALAASWLADHYRAPVMLFALLIGMTMNFVGQDKRMRPGIDFAARPLLRCGVVLLGARITLDQAVALGWPTVLLATAGVALAIGTGLLAARLLGLSRGFGMLAGGAVGICGGSAALAIASVLPQTPQSERETMLTVVAVTAIGTIAMVVYPALVAALGLHGHTAGIFIGTTIHDIAQVIGAGYGIGKETGDTAVIVKMVRVALLAPVVLAATLMFRKSAASGMARPPLVPGFLIGFVALVVINSAISSAGNWAGVMPAAVTALATDASRWCFVAAISALGAKTALSDLVKVGPRPVLAIVVPSLAVLLLSMLVLAVWQG
jgi:uncharacterized integral membrane protein (TIGR00698 family)